MLRWVVAVVVVNEMAGATEIVVGLVVLLVNVKVRWKAEGEEQ